MLQQNIDEVSSRIPPTSHPRKTAKEVTGIVPDVIYSLSCLPVCFSALHNRKDIDFQTPCVLRFPDLTNSRVSQTLDRKLPESCEGKRPQLGAQLPLGASPTSSPGRNLEHWGFDPSRLLRPISLLTLSVLTLPDSNFPVNPLWAWKFHPVKLRLCLSQTL